MEPQAPENSNVATGAVQVVSPAARPAGKFLYAGGARPLDGYTIKRGVGQGGFGEIYYAVSDAGKEVALKLIRRNLEVELRGIRQCLNLKHPHLLSLFDIRQDDNGDTWVIMEFVGGRSLQEALELSPQGLPVDEALAWMHGIGAAVAYLHDHGIVHRDLKPGNVFSDEGVVKVGDYGLSKFISCSRRSGHTESIGTVHYMAPEVANGRYGKELDVYAMGVVLYEMLTGRVPFEGESVGEVLMKHLTAQPDLTMLPEPYKTIIARALEKDPEKRYPSATEFLAALPPCPTAVGPSRLPAESSVPASGGPAEVRPLGRFAGDAVPARAASRFTFPRNFREDCRAVRLALSKLNMLNTLLKTTIVMSVLFALIMSEGMFLAAPLIFLMIYGLFYVSRAIVVWSEKKPAGSLPSEKLTVAAPPLSTPAAAPAPAVNMEPVSPQTLPYHALPRRWPYRRELSLPALVLGTPRQRVTELLGSLLLSAFVVAAMTILLFLMDSYKHQDLKIEQFTWLYIVALAGSWTVLLPSKLWEGTRGEALLRRFVMMVLGLGLSVFACGMASYLIVDFPPCTIPDLFEWQPQGNWNPYDAPRNFYSPAGQPLLPAYVACFGTLFFLIRWWCCADPLRAKRLSLGRLFLVVAAGVVVAWGWHFPQPWLMMIVASISVSVQLSSPWLSPRERMHPRL